MSDTPKFSVNQITGLLNMQNHINNVVDENWVANDCEWYRAVYTEAVECVEYIGWKWWKKIEPNTDQLKLELIDILHFALSGMVQARDGNLEEAINLYNNHVKNTEYVLADDATLIEVMEMIVEIAIVYKKDSIGAPMVMDALHVAFKLMDMDISEVYLTYTGKYTLNVFRQDNGYKNGNYRRIWQGKDDNVHLANIINTFDDKAVTAMGPGEIQNHIYNKLETLYTSN